MNALIGNGTRYDLFSHDGRRRIVWRFRDEGVMVEDNALAVLRASRWTRIPFRSIASVTLSASVVGRSGLIGNCAIRLTDGRQLVIGSANDQGFGDGQRDGPYRLFLRDFHQRLIASGDAGTIRFGSGYGNGRLGLLVFAAVLGTGLFVLLPLWLLLTTGDLKALVISLVGAGFIWPAWRMIDANRHAAYAPDAPPDLLE